MLLFALIGQFALLNAQAPSADPNGFTPTPRQPCNVTHNSPSGLNYYGCNNAGRCEYKNSITNVCKCCDIYDSTSWCSPTMENGEVYGNQILDGTTCSTLQMKEALTMGWRFETAAGETSPLVCNDVANNIDCSGSTVFCTPNMDLSPQVEFALQYPCGNEKCTSVMTGEVGEFYVGEMHPIGCQTCTPENPCSRTSAIATDGIVLAFATFMNSYYDRDCKGDIATQTPGDCPLNDDYGHKALWAWGNSRGPTGSNQLITRTITAILTGEHPFCASPPSPFPSDICLGGSGFSESPAIAMPVVYRENVVESERENFILVTDIPTTAPSPAPSPSPSPAPTVQNSPCFKYTNRVLDHKFLGTGSSCLGGFEDTWTGGKTCDSPYIVCLPAENTPANPNATVIPNIGQTLPATDYSVLECAEECAYDQRCSGFQLMPAVGSPRGDCMLIDDIDVVVENKGTWPTIGSKVGNPEVTVLSAQHVRAGLPTVGTPFAGKCCAPGNGQIGFFLPATPDQCRDYCFDNADCTFFTVAAVACTLCDSCPIAGATDTATDTSTEVSNRVVLATPDNFDAADGDVLCFAKEDYCNPYFEAEDLNEEMLQCYCPNNRKGFYTKKVKRTVPNTKFCQSGFPDINRRIKKAQANRMFHLCENWCLFETSNPQSESWYWNPWLKCWREQYAGIGTHRSYCNRVIKTPDTIEQQFINNRSTMFCSKDEDTNDIIDEITMEPTGQPSVFNSNWYLAEEEKNCVETCDAQGKLCDEGKTNSLLTGTNADMDSALTEASGPSCSSYETALKGWAAPGLKVDDNTCLLRDPATQYTGCQWAIGVGYKRLCACYSP